MKLFFIAVLAALVATVTAWTNEDYEIFDLVTSVEVSEGKGTTFYSWLDVPPTASTADIGKAYRKMSIHLHPDKNPGVKGVHERFSRLGVVATILRNQESRERYDFFFKNGVPKWRGTGYYYSRFRPGLVSVFVFLTVLTSGLQYLVHWMNYKRDLERVERFVKDARTAAWGPKMNPLEGKRKVKVNLGEPGRVDEDGNALAMKSIDMVVDGQAVYILDPSGTLVPLDASAAVPPAISKTWFVSLVTYVYQRVIPKGKGKRDKKNPSSKETGGNVDGAEADGGYESSASSPPGSGTVTPRERERGEVKGGRLAAVKTGGKRRKAGRK